MHSIRKHINKPKPDLNAQLAIEIDAGNLPKIKKLMKAGATGAWQDWETGNNLIQHAIDRFTWHRQQGTAYPLKEIVKYLCQLKNLPIQHKNKFDESMLHTAISYQATIITDELLSLNVDLSLKNQDHLTPIAQAAKDQQWNTVFKIIRHHKFEAASEDPYEFGAALFYAVWFGKFDVVWCLLDAMANPNWVDLKHDEDSLLHIAIKQHRKATREQDKKAYYEILFALLESREIEPSTPNTKGITPLHLACQFGLEEIAILLIKQGANLNVADSQGNLPIHYAARTGNAKLFGILTQHSADLSYKNLNGKIPFDLIPKACDFDPFENAIEKQRAIVSEAISDSVSAAIQTLKLPNEIISLEICKHLNLTTQKSKTIFFRTQTSNSVKTVKTETAQTEAVKNSLRFT